MSKAGHFHVVNCLLENMQMNMPKKKQDTLVNLADSEGKTALFNACDKGHYKIVQLLCAKGKYE